MPNRKLREYGAPIGVPKMIEAGRPKVGPADPATRRKALKEALAATEPTPWVPEPIKDAKRRVQTLKDRGGVALREKQLRDLGE
jgi:hypothetical protein